MVRTHAELLSTSAASDRLVETHVSFADLRWANIWFTDLYFAEIIRRQKSVCLYFFVFQAEDGIRDYKVTEFRRVLFRSAWPRAIAGTRATRPSREAAGSSLAERGACGWASRDRSGRAGVAISAGRRSTPRAAWTPRRAARPLPAGLAAASGIVSWCTRASACRRVRAASSSTASTCTACGRAAL